MSIKFFVYIDYTTENVPRPYYVCKGNQNRTTTTTRNQRHKEIMAEFGWRREIVIFTTDFEISSYYERQFIAKLKTNYHRADEGHWGVNATDGGEGTFGTKHTPEHRAARSKWMSRLLLGNTRAKGNKGKKQSAEHIENNAKARTGRIAGPLRPEHRARISAKLSGRKQTPEQIEAVKQSKLRKKLERELIQANTPNKELL